ncbi:Uncharacterised protein [BD1-7 clade bacterium]|uniref:DUF1800 domain-containing protein n=1 Tax=BD1-7 clade bacterium TaxID=2029982 RepID=A0A5S9PJY9_9GAMM|nr:Uncharacterised protein [BD1-7 clade bacterium]
MVNTLEEASIFLMQATLGADFKTIEQVSNLGIEHWLDDQLDQSWDVDDSFLKKTSEVWRGGAGDKGFRQNFVQRFGESAINGEGNNPAIPYKWYFRMAWWHRTLAKAGTAKATVVPMTGKPAITAKEANTQDLLRHRVAQALSEIIVVSENSNLENDAEGLASFYDLLYQHAFGSYRDLLEDVSLHPVMGVYLSHMNNQKADPARNIHPDENYAREIMQLFSIGLFELNPDGSRKKDASGKDIPTYDNDDIKVMARVFTGLKASKYQYEWPSARIDDGDGNLVPIGSINGNTVTFNDGVSKSFKIIPYVDMVSPMTMDEAFHDTDTKQLLNGHIQLPAGNAGIADIQQAVTGLVSHPSTAPFIALRLIQQLVTSNPTPAYVQAVAQAFGPQGNLKETIKVILSYPLTNPVTIPTSAGATDKAEKLKSPLLRITQILRAFKARNSTGQLWVTGDAVKQEVNQLPMGAPSVFNFYKPDFSPHGILSTADKVAPEFELHNSTASIKYVNYVYAMLFGKALPLVSTKLGSSSTVPELNGDALLSSANDQNKLTFNFIEELTLAADRATHDQLIDRVSLVLTGKTNLTIKDDIKSTIVNYNPSEPQQRLWIVQSVVFLIAISPDFAVLEA